MATELRYDKATGEELFPPTKGKPYWHALPPTGGGPLVAAPPDDPYSLGDVEVRPKVTKSALSPLVSPELYVKTTGRELCVLIDREGAAVSNEVHGEPCQGWTTGMRFGHGKTVKEAMRNFIECLHAHGEAPL